MGKLKLLAGGARPPGHNERMGGAASDLRGPSKQSNRATGTGPVRAHRKRCHSPSKLAAPPTMTLPARAAASTGDYVDGPCALAQTCAGAAGSQRKEGRHGRTVSISSPTLRLPSSSPPGHLDVVLPVSNRMLPVSARIPRGKQARLEASGAGARAAHPQWCSSELVVARKGLELGWPWREEEPSTAP